MSTLSTFRFDEKLTNTIEELKEATSSSSKSEIVRRSIALMQIVQQAAARGERVIIKSKDEDGNAIEREIIIT